MGFLVEKFKYGNVNFTMFDSQWKQMKQLMLHTADVARNVHQANAGEALC